MIEKQSYHARKGLFVSSEHAQNRLTNLKISKQLSKTMELNSRGGGKLNNCTQETCVQ